MKCLYIHYSQPQPPNHLLTVIPGSGEKYISDLVIEFWTQTHLNIHPWQLTYHIPLNLLVGFNEMSFLKRSLFRWIRYLPLVFRGHRGHSFFTQQNPPRFPPDFKSSSWLEILQAPPDLGNGRASRPESCNDGTPKKSNIAPENKPPQ